MNLNKAMLIGNLTRDPEIKNTPSGQTVATFAVATNLIWKDQSGQKQEKVEFHNIVAWRRLAEICGQYLHKGSKIYIEGRLQTRNWTGQDGIKRYRTEIVAENMIMLDRIGAERSQKQESAPMPEEFSSEPAINADEPVASGPENKTANPDEEEIKVENIPF
ncbi:single-stranded DNA-binding protein [Candidatus Falkowbacteria bacterium CG_4_9_14_3_um_filter_36_9]|uniref:Single-stranded DNA-binding protein n=1 Tax=Candidatus Falkowbacteria bacterium CG02_land_8_20_14_3_00_36_14 TaxID=1974560 RepID=A0A2M7DQX7_9BACT|nr:MAG: single-stranded DNA-binding protein [Candidatus Falkowbacteria bacterium CG02_land_8_20_14_3_00_36_14]PIX10937.1 MAG: single-stranded DNA-binding protein [Candidatus Falkowbacteria bacterium CG_4_8_14_3_um_filter_36_11]PJA11000.1 MAG: single-stranded DNA-binding protein [Candidatus Falkowbacteria bacterium CG_4_10_14_0_2_um_filter_36_22]PJB18200.1 MAG: single-stranded DNA-binding protein [Candidatus Falkowbacteria bacterium CG_4_9_14_3_um_filter_36_9]